MGWGNGACVHVLVIMNEGGSKRSCIHSFLQYGKLGHSNESGQATPKRVEGLVGLTVSQVACGVSTHMLMVP